MKKFIAIAPAKINLQLKVYPIVPKETHHEVETVMQTLTLHDKLTFFIPENEGDFKEIENKRTRKINDAWGIKETQSSTFTKNNLSISILIDDRTGQNMKIPVDANLITKSLISAAKTSQTANSTHIEVFLEKNIPAQAGLGGGSSDAAAALVVAKQLFSINENQLTEIASELGADVPFFLTGGRTKMCGTGSTVAKKMTSLKKPVVVVKPHAGINTKQCYCTFDENHETMLPQGEFSLQNDLQHSAISLCSEIASALCLLEKHCNHENVLMTGSGSACFGICDTFKQASNIAALAIQNDLWAHACSCANIKATLID